MKSLDENIESIQRSKADTSYKLQKGLSQAVQLYDLLSKDRGIVDYSMDRSVLRPREDVQLEHFTGKKEKLQRKMMRDQKQRDTLAAQVQAMQMFLETFDEQKIQSTAEFRSSTHDKNLDAACAMHTGKKGGMDAFRKRLLAAPKRFLSGKHLKIEHLFRPDGTARSTPSEVCMAIRLYGGRRFWGGFGK